MIAAYSPECMGAGSWNTAIYIDEKAADEQRSALGRILSGDIGGPMANWMALTTDFRGIKYSAIIFEADGDSRRVIIPNVMDFNIEGIRAGRIREVMRLENVGHPVSSTLSLARGTASTYTDHGMTWDNTEKSAAFAEFSWSWL